MDAWKRNAAIFLTSQTLSLLGSSLVQYALMWYVTLETKSGLMMTLFVISGFLPTFILSPFAGVLADRHDRKKLIMLSDAMIALITLALALVFMQGEKALWLFFVAAAVRAVGTSIQGPAVGAFLPQIIPTEHLTRIGGINGTIQALIMLLSPGISGLLLSYAPLPAIFFIDVVTAILAIGVLAFFLKVPPHEKASHAQSVSYFGDMKLGLHYIRDHRYLITFFVWLGLLFLLIAPAAFMTPLQVVRSYGGEYWRLTAIEIAFSIGMMFGGAIIAAWGGFKNRMVTMLLSGAVMGMCTVIFGLAPHFWVYLAIMALFGISMPFYNTPMGIVIQEHVEEAFMGRVFSVLTMLSTSMMPLGMLIFGPLAEIIPIEWILIITGATVLLLNILMTLNRRLIEAGVKPSAPSQEEPPSEEILEKN